MWHLSNTLELYSLETKNKSNRIGHFKSTFVSALYITNYWKYIPTWIFIYPVQLNLWLDEFVDQIDKSCTNFTRQWAHKAETAFYVNVIFHFVFSGFGGQLRRSQYGIYNFKLKQQQNDNIHLQYKQYKQTHIDCHTLSVFIKKVT